MIRQAARHVGDLDIVDVVVPQHLFGDFGPRQSAGEGNLGVFAEHRLQPRLHDEAGYADQDNQEEHAHRCRRVVVDGGLLRVVACLEQEKHGVYHGLEIFLQV